MSLCIWLRPSVVVHRFFYIKLLHGILPCGKIAHRYDAHSTHVCPLCSSPNEDWLHMLQCPHPKRQEWRIGFLSRLRKLTTKLETPSTVEMMFVTGVTNCLCQSSEEFHCNASWVSEQQDLLRWPSIFLGLLGSGWRDVTGVAASSWTEDILEFIWCEL